MSDGVGSPARRRGLLSAGFVTLALVGEWLGHAGSWWLSGGVGPGRALSGPMHTYLGPVGLVLAGLAVGVSGLIWWTLAQLSRATRSVRAALGRAWQRDRAVRRRAEALAEVDAASRQRPVGVGRLWLALLTVQVVVYLTQESVELRLLGLGGGGFHVVVVHHGLPLLVHAAVALVGAVVAALVADGWRAQAGRAAQVGRVYARLVPSAPTSSSRRPPRPRAVPLRERFGLSFAARPPPGWMLV